MKRNGFNKRGLFLLGVVTSTLACQRNAGEGAAAKAEGATAERPTTTLPRGPGEPRAEDASAELAALDPRRPVPLLPMMAWHQKQSMMQHLVVIQQIVAATAKEDWDAVAAAAQGIEASESERRTCQHMGAGAEGFVELALDFHDRATAIGKAAQAHDSAAVLSATANTLQACTTCHAAYRQEVLDVASWQERTGGDLPAHGAH